MATEKLIKSRLRGARVWSNWLRIALVLVVGVALVRRRWSSSREVGVIVSVIVSVMVMVGVHVIVVIAGFVGVAGFVVVVVVLASVG